MSNKAFEGIVKRESSFCKSGSRFELKKVAGQNKELDHGG